MIKISNPLIKQGELITHYNGYNRKINQSEQHLTSQRIKFITSQALNGGEEANYCFEFKLLNRKFLMVLDQEKLYEILEMFFSFWLFDIATNVSSSKNHPSELILINDEVNILVLRDNKNLFYKKAADYYEKEKGRNKD